MLREVEREAGLADAGSGGEDDEVGLLEPGGQRVQVREPGADAADLAPMLVQVVESVIRGVQQAVERREPARDPLLADREQCLLGAVDGTVEVGRVVVADARDAPRRPDQVPQDPLPLHDARVVDGVDRGRREIDEAGQVRRPADPLQLPVTLQGLRHRDQVHRLPALVQLEDGAIDGAMVRAIEVVRPEHLRDLDDRIAVDEQGAQHRSLGLDGLRW